jgi:hypothetical protein
MGRVSRFAVFALGILTGCHAHVRLPSADVHASESDRMYQYRRYALQSTRAVTVRQYDHGQFVGGYSFLQGITLADGTFVYHAEDLIPLAGERSPVADSARESLASNRVADAVMWSGIGSIVLGLGLIPCAFACVSLGGAPQPSAPLFLTAAVLVLGGIGTSIASSVPRWAAQRRREHAYQEFDGSLQRNLRLCGPGAPLGECPPSRPAVPVPWTINGSARRGLGVLPAF